MNKMKATTWAAGILLGVAAGPIVAGAIGVGWTIGLGLAGAVAVNQLLAPR